MQPTQPMIRIEGLIKTYGVGAEAVSALRGVDLTVERGQIFGIIGMSGAGKSTLIRCINLLDAPTSGKIYIDGQDMTTLPAAQLRAMRRSVGMVFQQFNLLMQRNVLRNVCYPLEIAGVKRDAARKRAMALLEVVGLTDKASAFPAQLSGGQKQRVAIARALAMDPKVLLCDEATSALDPLTTRSILALLKDINERLGITIIVITHEMQVVRQICTHLAIIDDGMIAESGSMDQVYTHPHTAAGRRLFWPEGGELAREAAHADIHNSGPGAEKTGDSAQSAPQGALVRVVFDTDETAQPVIAQMILAIGTPVSIESADVQIVSGRRRGQMLLRLPDDEALKRKAIEYLSGRDLVVEEVSDDDGDATDSTDINGSG